MIKRSRLIFAGLMTVLLLSVQGCGRDLSPPETLNQDKPEGTSIFGGERGINLTEIIGRGRENSATRGGEGGLAVNKFLWRASVQTLSFLPVNVADPSTGFIQTEWYTPSPQERLRVEVFILGKDFKTESLEVAVHQQVASQSGWISQQVTDSTRRSLENAILLRARQLRVASLQ